MKRSDGINTHDKLITPSSERVKRTQSLSDGYRRETREEDRERELNRREEGVKSHMRTCVIEAVFLIIAAVRVLTSQMCYILPRVQRCSRSVTAMQITIV